MLIGFRRGWILTLELVVVLAAAVIGAVAAQRRLADYNASGIVETADLFDFAQAYRNRSEPRAARAADVNRDGRADELDIFLFLREWNADRDKALAGS